MDRELPSIWRAYRMFFLIVWITVVVAVSYVIWDVGGSGGLATAWFPVSAFLLAGVVFTLGSVVPALRARRAILLFVETVPGQSEVVQGGEMVVRWTDKPVEVRAAVGFLFILWHMKLRMPGEEWTFDTSSASVVARYARDRFEETPSATDDERPISWGLSQWVPWGVVSFGAFLVGGTFRLAGRPDLFVPAAASALLLGLILLVAGRVQTRAVMRRFVAALRAHGLLVDGPYVVEAGPAVRYVLFTDRGPLNVQPVLIGRLGALHAYSKGNAYRAHVGRADDLADQMVQRMSSASGPAALSS